jgi:RNA polymerase sigma-70 factor (ECF subfamily)
VIRDPFERPGDLLDRLYAYVAYRLGPGPLAEDVAADAFERGLRYRKRYDPKLGSPEAWLIGIARRCIADAVATPPTEELAETVAETNGFEANAHRRIDLAVAVGSLGERDRELVALRFGADLDAKTIARLLDMTPGAVDVAVHRALARLRGLLDEE